MLEYKARILDLCAYTRGTQELPRQGSSTGPYGRLSEEAGHRLTINSDVTFSSTHSQT